MSYKYFLLLSILVTSGVLAYHQIRAYLKRIENYFEDIKINVNNLLGEEADLPEDWRKQMAGEILSGDLPGIIDLTIFSRDGNKKILVIQSHFSILKWLVLRKDNRTSIVARTLEKETDPALGTGILLLRLLGMPWPDSTQEWLKRLDEVTRTKFPLTIEKMERYAGERTIAHLIS